VVVVVRSIPLPVTFYGADIITPTQLIETLSLGGAFRSVITNCLKFHLSFEICKSKAFVDIVVSQQKQAILNIKTMIVPPIKLGAIS
jgi:hypothetical protein